MSFIQDILRIFGVKPRRTRLPRKFYDWPRVEEASLAELLPDPPRPPPPPTGVFYSLIRPLDPTVSKPDIPFACDPQAFCKRIRQGVQDVYGGNPVAFYRAAGITRSAYSCLAYQPHHHPSKKTALAMAAALHLGLSDAENFLWLAGYALSPAYATDQIWRWCFEHGVYDLEQIKSLLAKLPDPRDRKRRSVVAAAEKHCDETDNQADRCRDDQHGQLNDLSDKT